MGKIIKNNVVYGGVPDEVITAWETEDVQDLSEIEYGDADISGIGDGSITGAIAEHEDNINDIDEAIGNTNISSIGDGTVTGAISTLNSNLLHFKYVSISGVSIASGAHENKTLSFEDTPTIKLAFIVRCMNPAWVFGSVVSWTRNSVTVGLYNSATVTVSDPFLIGILY